MKTIINKPKKFTITTILAASMVGLLLATAPPIAWSQPEGPTTDPFLEIDANPVDEDNATYPGDDWTTFYPSPVSTNPYFIDSTGIITDNPQKSIFTGGGSKDTRDITEWKWTDGSVPDKDDILHGYFAAYGDTELVFYIGADRFSNDGDAMMGAWFFQDIVTAQPDGSFSGKHRNGDILWLGHFSGGGVISTLEIYVWDDSVKNNLRLIASGQGSESAGYYAAVNTADVASPWPYTPKDGTPEFFPYNSFMEGGINLSYLMGQDSPCFNSVLLETRSSTSVVAQLKDFVLGNLSTCSISVAKECLSSEIAPDLESINYSYSVHVTNTGYGSLSSVSLDDTMYGPWTYSGVIATGATAAVTPGGVPYIINSTDNPPASNTVTAIGYAGTYPTAPVTDAGQCTGVQLDPKLSLNQGCTDVKVVGLDGKVVVKVGFAGQVCNRDTVTKLQNVTVTHEAAGVVLTVANLMPGDCASFSGFFYPGPLDIDEDGTPALQEFGKSVSASGTEPITGEVKTVTANPDPATSCRLCTPCP